ncbi:Hypothetical_protein [Hexamita inflata]|uniref:Hypothetical_protein n=1 Tax=Hexamita inflata TaxID=28002 RepID=A0AA86QNC6_9EUKA|nr:Hypothetical protein HINF_LOCUS50466 [Hexamita inflata]
MCIQFNLQILYVTQSIDSKSCIKILRYTSQSQRLFQILQQTVFSSSYLLAIYHSFSHQHAEFCFASSCEDLLNKNRNNRCWNDIKYKGYMSNQYELPEHALRNLQEQIGVLTEMLSIDKINMCNIWPADGCSTPETCTYYQQCSQSCNSKCLYNSGNFTRILEPDMYLGDSIPTTFPLNGMLYCDYSAQKLSIGASVGIAIGVIIAVVIIIVVLFAFKRNSGRPNKNQKQMKNSYI